VSSWANGVWRRVGNVLSMTESGTATAVKGEKMLTRLSIDTRLSSRPSGGDRGSREADDACSGTALAFSVRHGQRH
jgi:hypothetical protein